MSNDFDSTHPRRPPSDGDNKTHIAVLRERVDQHHIRLTKIDDTIEELCDRMTKIEVLRESGAKVSWFVASGFVSLTVGIVVFVLNRMFG